MKTGTSQKFKVGRTLNHATCLNRHPVQITMMSADSAWPKCAVLFFTFHLTPGAMHVQNYVKDGLSPLHPASPIKLALYREMATYSHSAILRKMHIPISGAAS